MKSKLFIALLVLLTAFFTMSNPASAQSVPPEQCGTPGFPECTPNHTCAIPNPESQCTLVGNGICTVGGCWRLYCNSWGCDLVFESSNPFHPREQEP